MSKFTTRGNQIVRDDGARIHVAELVCEFMNSAGMLGATLRGAFDKITKGEQ